MHPALFNSFLCSIGVIRDQRFIVFNDRITVLFLNDRGYLRIMVIIHIGSYPITVIKEPHACFKGAGLDDAGFVVGGNRGAGFNVGGSFDAGFIRGGILSA